MGREYTTIVQPKDGTRDFWLTNYRAADAASFAKWLHKTTGAAVCVYDQTNMKTRLQLGDFDDRRT
jgi:hypothetical protein